MMMYRTTASKAFTATFIMATLAACSSTALEPGRSVLDVAQAKNDALVAAGQQPQSVAYAVHPSGFPWAVQTLKATGHGRAPEGMPAPQAEMTATNSARVHALTNLKEQVKALPVGTDQTIGSITEAYITIRHAIEQEIAQAQVTESTPLPQGGIEVQVQLPMQQVATILQQYQITPDQELPAVGGMNPAAVPDII